MTRFTIQDLERASSEWQCSCGPAALAAICGMTLDEMCPHFPGFRGWTNPSMMLGALDRVAPNWRSWRPGRNGESRTWPRYGLALIQFEGPWTAPGQAWARRVAPRFTHWVGVQELSEQVSISGARDVGIWDINCVGSDLSSSGWVTLDEWEREIVPGLVESFRRTDKRVSGGWHVTHAIEVQR